MSTWALLMFTPLKTFIYTHPCFPPKFTFLEITLHISSLKSNISPRIKFIK